MCEAYTVSVECLSEMIVYFEKSVQEKLLNYVPMGSNYCEEINGCDNRDDKTIPCSLCFRKIEKNSLSKTNFSFTRKYNGLECSYYEFGKHYFHNTNICLKEHFNRTHPPAGHEVIVDVETFEIINNNMMISSKPLQMILRQKCLYDSSKQETYEYQIQTHKCVKLLFTSDSLNPLISQWFDTIPIKGYVKNEKMNNLNPESYESLYTSETMTIREHVMMYQRDSEQCNHNTVNFGTQYMLLISQNQFNMLKNAYMNDRMIKPLSVEMVSVDNTNTVTGYLGSKEPIHRPITYNEIRPMRNKPGCNIL